MDYVLGLPVKISLSLNKTLHLIFCGIEFLAAKEESDNQNHSKPIILVVIPRVFATDFGLPLMDSWRYSLRFSAQMP